ncbi:MAG: hypothetical protein JO260_06885 [Acidobacteria bacterium]|nr:hypothetical protein [Acidobacteriota bacterium]
MILAAKVALVFAGTIAAAGVYTLHDGVAQVQVDDNHGTHVHIWAPAAIVPMALQVVPNRELHKFPHEAQQAIPMLRVLTHELEKYPNTEFVEVRDSETHVRVRTVGSKVVVDVVDPENKVHVVCPLAMIQEVVESLSNIREDQDDSGPTV